jgi:hypothetical protein
MFINPCHCFRVVRLQGRGYSCYRRVLKLGVWLVGMRSLKKTDWEAEHDERLTQ